RVRFYLNNGAPFNGYPTPGTNLFDSDWFGGFGPTPRSTLIFTNGVDFPSMGLDLTSVVSNMTWSIEFRGLGATDDVGVDIYSPPVVGGNYPDYWDNSAGWTLKTNTGPMDFASRFFASQTPVPEPS